ncbi:MAG: lysine--tRNA ligase [Thermofilum sp. ex4484_15]|nr:MAG: lysine--tRNA ligase [Thermofilum sp. ex4484_15]
MEHWVERLARKVEEEFGDRGILVCNGGLSVSGLQHVGRLRGEVTIKDSVARALKEKGFEVESTLVLYTMDPWRGKEAQLKQFERKEEALNYIGLPLDLVPDPYGCHDNWVEHYWEDFGNYLGEFSSPTKIVTTRELYSSNIRMKEFVKLAVGRKREEVLNLLNKYRGRKPYPKEWIPFQPICGKCKRIDSTKTLEVDLVNGKVKYVCTNCGYEGIADLSEGKLMWRLEWVGVWYALKVAFEPYGKDHATPGGSRDSCNELALKVFGFKPPVGVAYEWVGYAKRGKDLGDMGSSDFIGFTPKDWLEVAEAEVLRFIYLYNAPLKRIVLSMERVPSYVDLYDKAERVYYGVEKLSDRGEEEKVIKSFTYANLKPLPKELPFKLPYLHAVALIQVVPPNGNIVEEALRRVKATKLLERELSPEEVEGVKIRLLKARSWLEKYAPETYKIRVLEEVNEELVKKVGTREAELIAELYTNLIKLRSWDEKSIKEAMVKVRKGGRDEEVKFFKALYLAFFGREYGPRIAPYFSILGRDFVLDRLRKLLKIKGILS